MGGGQLQQKLFQGAGNRTGKPSCVFITCSISCNDLCYLHEFHSEWILCVVCCMTRRHGKEHVTMLSVVSLFLTFSLNIYFLSVSNPWFINLLSTLVMLLAWIKQTNKCRFLKKEGRDEYEIRLVNKLPNSLASPFCSYEDSALLWLTAFLF